MQRLLLGLALRLELPRDLRVSGVLQIFKSLPFSSLLFDGRKVGVVVDLLKIIEEENIPDGVSIEVCTDSKYVQGVLSLGWKAKSNRELIMNIKQRMRNRGNIRLHWVAGHAGISQNERADELAVLAIEAS